MKYNNLSEVDFREEQTTNKIDWNNFQLNRSQIWIEDALELTVFDLFNHEDENIELSKMDIWAITALVDGDMKGFLKMYKEYAVSMKEDKKRFCLKPHWFFKGLFDDRRKRDK